MSQPAKEKVQKAGLCWVRPEQWQRLLEVAEDSDRLESSWEEWQSKSLEMIEVFATRGIEIEKVDVDVEALIAWCQEKDKPVNASTRAEYVTALMMEQKKTTSGKITQH
ncbi:hypothetical protein SAMN05660443_0966 [Marinospirillum celere]|uniref:Uncharacterized protein n=1 Tax=Marinospirillum celere TaxID=1122252 RepID=A0A1I1FE85_9GAMM|nr:hypothetical protein [Marinospirillum celere]SFB97611.1 hypothetical protein SAMN05660443_0966 [Marinospirillum celere]